MENEILNQILGELKEIRGGISNLDKRVGGLENRMDGLEKELKDVKELAQSTHNAVLRIELVEVPKIQLTLEGISENNKKINEHEDRIQGLEKTTVLHSMEIAALKKA